MGRIFLIILMLVSLVVSAPPNASSRYIDTIRSVKTANIVQILMRNETSGTVAYDSSSIGNNGSYTGTITSYNQNGFSGSTKSIYVGGAGYAGGGMSYAKNGNQNDSGTVMYWYKQNDTGMTATRFQTWLYYGADGASSAGYDNTKRWIVNNRYGSVDHYNYYLIGTRFLTDWVCHVITWSKARRFVKHYLNGNLFIADTSFSGYAAATYDYFIGTGFGTYSIGNIGPTAAWKCTVDSNDVKTLAASKYVNSILVYGNSITAGTGASTVRTNYAYLLREKLNLLVLYNAGISSTLLQNDTATNSGINRWKRDIIPYRPDLLFILYGTNDRNTPAYQSTYNTTFKTDYLRLIDSLNLYGIQKKNIHISTLMTASTDNQILDSFNISIKSIAKLSRVKIAQTFDSTAPYRSTCLADALHPNDQGHALIANAFYAAYLSRLSSTTGSRKGLRFTPGIKVGD